MTITTGTLLALLGLLLGLVLGSLLGLWWGRRTRSAEDPEQMRIQLAIAQAKLEGAESQLREHAIEQRQDQRILDLLNPLSTQVSQLGTQVNALERDRVKHFGAIQSQLNSASATDRALLSNTQALVQTLKATSARGHWGEVQLRRVVEAAGMLRHVDFSEQTSIRNAEDKIQRPDMVVRLPGDKVIAVDAKAPLAAVLAAEELAEDPTEHARTRREELSVEHAKAVRQHVDQLAKRQYWAGLSNSPNFVVCFLPAESYLAAAVEQDAELLDHAFSQGVALVSPVSLLATLKSVAYAWQQDALVDNAQDIFRAATMLQSRLAKVGEHLADLGRSLNTSVTRYNTLLGSVERRLLPAARHMESVRPGTVPFPSTKPVTSSTDPVTAPELLEDFEESESPANPHGPSRHN